MWDASGNWNLDSLSITFPPHIIDSIIAIPKSSHAHQLDIPFWLSSSNGLFTSNSAYLPTLDPPPHLSYLQSLLKMDWKLPTLPRITTFLWLACHGNLPTKKLLLQRKILTDSSCPLFRNSPESLFHIYSQPYMVQSQSYSLTQWIPFPLGFWLDKENDCCQWHSFQISLHPLEIYFPFHCLVYLVN